jgi:hypothetical protein
MAHVQRQFKMPTVETARTHAIYAFAPPSPRATQDIEKRWVVTQFTARQTRDVTRGHAASIRGRETDSARLRERAIMKRQGSVNHVEYLSRHRKRARTHISRIEQEALQGYARTPSCGQRRSRRYALNPYTDANDLYRMSESMYAASAALGTGADKPRTKTHTHLVTCDARKQLSSYPAVPAADTRSPL